MPVLSDNQKIGVLLTGIGLLFLFLGVLLFFDRGLLTIGDIVFVAGLTLVMGAQKTARFFFQQHKLKGTACFFGGILLVLSGWTFIGMFVEVFGFINLFGDFFPHLLWFARRLPIVGTILNYPVVRKFTDRIVSKESLPV